jgi:rhamnulose-1-phosphate aldolase
MPAEIHNLEILNTLADMAELGRYLWQKGWAERNAGNISVNISHWVTDELDGQLPVGQSAAFPLNQPYPAIEGSSFLVTGTGKRMRDLGRDPRHNALLIKICLNGDSYRIYPLCENGMSLQPTSELPTHLSIHEQLVKSGAKERAVVHTHPNELIAITQIRRFCDQDALNRLLWGMHPETMVFIPEGIGFIPYLVPGSDEIARATLKKFQTHKVILWEKHGSFAIGKDVFDAFDLIDTLAKSARIYFQCRSAGHEPEGLPDDKLQELKELSEKFLTS